MPAIEQVSVARYGEIIGKSRWTVYRMIAEEKLPRGVRAKSFMGTQYIEVTKAFLKKYRVLQDLLKPVVKRSAIKNK